MQSHIPIITRSGQLPMRLPYVMSLKLACNSLSKFKSPLLRLAKDHKIAPLVEKYSFTYSAGRFRTFATAAVDEEFFAPAGTSFASLGIDERLCSTLQAAGFNQASHSQFLAAPPILKGRNVVLAAETGSGKTLAYLAPLATLALAERAAATAPDLSTPPPPSDDWLEPLPDDPLAERPRRTATLVLCPNALLCQQVVTVAGQAFKDPTTGEPLINVSLVTSSNPPPYDLPDVVVTTPGALATLLDGAGPAFGPDWTRTGFSAWARHIVLDEADLLLGGGYAKHLDLILDLLKTGDREAAAKRACAELGIPVEEYWEMPRLLRKAVQSGGAKAALEAGYKPPEWATPPTGVQGVDYILPWLRQYVFVAATMPREGGKNVGTDISTAYPDTLWLSGRQLHQARRSLTHSWKEYSSLRGRDEALIETIESDAQIMQGEGRMMVFTKDVTSANETAAVLREFSSKMPPIVVYHSGVPAAERATALSRMSLEQGLILVCTDAAARGLDIENVTHVVQADFAGSAIDYLHRVGRTARAGKTGAVTSLYATEVAALVDAIRDAVAEGRPVDGAFSRKRSFNKKFKKYGKFVPRGQLGPGAETSRPR
jgi:superfamily II DNA/RNA helicase